MLYMGVYSIPFCIRIRILTFTGNIGKIGIGLYCHNVRKRMEDEYG